MEPLALCLEKFGRVYPDIAPKIARADPLQLPDIDVRSLIRSLDLTQVEDVIVYGVGKGEIYQQLHLWLHEGWNKTLLFVESDRRVLKALFQTDIGKKIMEDERTELLFLDAERPARLFHRLQWQGVERKSLYLGDPRIPHDKFQHFQQHVQNNKDRIEHKDYSHFGMNHYVNYFPNLHELPHCYDGSSLCGKAKGIPAIIVGAGPSLNKNGPILSQFKERALIFAGGSALPALKPYGVTPHFGGGARCQPLAI